VDDQPHLPLTVPSRTAPLSEPDPSGIDEKPRVRPSQFTETPPPARRSLLRRILTWLVVLALLGGLVAWLVLRSQQPAPSGRFQSGGPMPVGTARVERGDMPIILTALGTVTPLATVTVKTQIAGYLMEVAFKEGQLVKKGDFLAQIDPRPYEVALAQAEGQLAKDQALLKNSEIDLARYRTLVAQNSIARQTLDTQAALVQQNRGTVQADQAQVDAQKLNLTYCRIIAPVGGRVGLRQVDAGNYVQTGDANGIVVITQIQPISVIFTLSEDNLQALLRRMHAGATLTVTAFDRTGANRIDSGTLETVDNQIDTSTGMVKLRAIFNNAEQLLFPNQFVNVQLLLDTMKDATLVPTAAVQRGAQGAFVYIVKPDETVAAQFVTLGPSNAQRVVVTKGLEPGQVVAVDGTDRLRDGAKVRASPATRAAGLPPGSEAAPPAAEPAAEPPTPAAEPAATPPTSSERQRGQGRRRSSE
jgi:multidrug efflux system membrane fusion protein